MISSISAKERDRCRMECLMFYGKTWNLHQSNSLLRIVKQACVTNDNPDDLEYTHVVGITCVAESDNKVTYVWDRCDKINFGVQRVEQRRVFNNCNSRKEVNISERQRSENIFPPAHNTMAEPEQAPEQPKATVQKQVIGKLTHISYFWLVNPRTLQPASIFIKLSTWLASVFE